MSRLGIMQHDHGNTKTRLAIEKNSSLDTLSEVKYCIDENSALLNTVCICDQRTLN
jgi:uncharacterized protein YkuJ